MGAFSTACQYSSIEQKHIACPASRPAGAPCHVERRPTRREICKDDNASASTPASAICAISAFGSDAAGADNDVRRQNEHSTSAAATTATAIW